MTAIGSVTLPDGSLEYIRDAAGLAGHEIAAVVRAMEPEAARAAALAETDFEAMYAAMTVIDGKLAELERDVGGRRLVRTTEILRKLNEIQAEVRNCL